MYNIFTIKLLLILCLKLFLLGCNNSIQEESFIDYDALPELQVTLAEEIIEDEDFYFGRIQDLIVDSQGDIIVSDWAKMAIKQFDSNGNYLGEIASGGEGPGELQTFFFLFHSFNDTLLVFYPGAVGQVDIYTREKDENRYQYKETIDTKRHELRNISLLGRAPGGGYFAKAEEFVQNRQSQLFEPEPQKYEPLLVVNEALEVLADSVDLLTIPNVVFIEAGGGAVSPLGTPPFLYRDVVRAVGQSHYMIAKPAEALIQFFDQNHGITNKIGLNVLQRPVSDADLENELENIPEEFRAKLIERAPEMKPAFKNAWIAKDKIFLHTDKTDKGSQIVVLTDAGQPLGKFYLSEFDEIKAFINNHIYTIHQDPDVGYSLKIYTIDL